MKSKGRLSLPQFDIIQMRRSLSNPEKTSEEMLGVCVASRSARACGLDSFGSHRKCGRVDVDCTRGSDVESRREHRDC